METKILYISGKPDMPKIKEAKASMDLGYLVVPRDADEAGVFDRVLAWGTKPKRLCDHALVGPQTSRDGLVAALRWVLEGGEDTRATTLSQWLSKIFKTEVIEVDPVNIGEYTKTQNLKKASTRFHLEEPGDSRERRRK